MYYINTDGESVEIKFTPKKKIKSVAKWTFDKVIISNDIFADDLNNYFSPEYIGSSHYISDDGYTFDRSDNLLVGAFLYVPDKNYFNPEVLNTILSFDSTDASIEIINPIKFNAVSPCDFRYLSRDGNYLLCLSNINLNGDIKRIKIHDFFEFIFLNKKMVGFLLIMPFENLVFFDDLNYECDNSSNITLSLDEKSIFLSYFDLVDEDGWDKINDGDLFMLSEINKIKNKITKMNVKHIQLKSLYKQCEFIVNNYYTN
ncbi:hypothetical protein GKR55_18850 [Providencia stuartii]|nr:MULTISPECIES: hypothetical protein [Providencia]SST02634.1 Uncharacterised protein [Acinetobacter baumannii]MDN0021343.1 hypothetical protein [Providencia stuartii]MDT1066153.1 hypothetical protein [Providencia stuartii]MDT2017055.1 hypothetical protein [Providencia stuartii]MDT2083224.1 hypothetical protein [Providencia stuartii]